MAGRILIADDLATNRILLRARLTAARYRVLLAESRRTAVSLAARETPDVALVDLGHPIGVGVATIRALKAGPMTKRTAVIAFAPKGDTEARREALQAGADDVMFRGVDEALLLARIRGLMRARLREAELGMGDETRQMLGFAEGATGFEGPGVIALVAHHADTMTGWRMALTPHLRDRIETVSPDALLHETEGVRPPDVYVIMVDPDSPHHGLRSVAELRSRVEARTAGIVTVFAPGDVASATTALDLGADDVVEQPIDTLELVLRLRAQLRRKACADRLHRQVSDGLRMAMTDPLTGLHNRRYALSHLSRIAETAFETGRPFAVMVLDLDRFKRVNDTFGHGAGDAVLVEASRRIAGSLRSVDLVARLGGEEFLVVMPDTGETAARSAGERLRKVIEASPFAVPGLPEPLPITVSVGVAIAGKRAKDSVDDLVGIADRALYCSKAEGRNQVTLGKSAA